MRRARRPRAAKRDGDNAGNRSESGRDAFQERVGRFHSPRITDPRSRGRGRESRLFPPAFPFRALARPPRLR